MVKALGAVLVVCACGLIGWLLTFSHKKKWEFIAEWGRFNRLFMTELSAKRMPLPKFIEGYASQNEFQTLLQAYVSSYSIESPPAFLKEEEKKLLSDYFSYLGTSDSSSQLSFLREKGNQLKELEALSLSDYSKRRTLYPKLGILAGLFLVVLLI
ncbi:MAG: stage III sporulation protein AB [Clostridia bacterium]|nr:stage III sporulation protein AB [Clostridia bacterium]